MTIFSTNFIKGKKVLTICSSYENSSENRLKLLKSSLTCLNAFTAFYQQNGVYQWNFHGNFCFVCWLLLECLSHVGQFQNLGSSGSLFFKMTCLKCCYQDMNKTLDLWHCKFKKHCTFIKVTYMWRNELKKCKSVLKIDQKKFIHSLGQKT